MNRAGKIAIVGGLVALSGLVGAEIGSAATHYQIRVNGAYVSPDVAPVVINGRMMVSARWIAEALGANVSYESSDYTAVITSPNKSPGLTVTTASRTASGIAGTVVNDGTQTAQAVTATATLWNSAGTVVGQPSVSLSPSSLAQGASASFSIPLTSAQMSETAAFEVIAGTAVGNVGDTLNGTEWENGGSLQTEPVATTFNSVTTPASIAGSLQTDTPPAGDEYVEVNLTVQNNGAATVDFDGLSELYVQDSAGNRYTPDLSTSIDAGNDLLGLSTLNAGQKVTGIAIFDVPTSATGLQLVWDSGTENQAFWNLGLQ